MKNIPGKKLLEICCDSYEAVCAARGGGADRVELCSGLAEGGITPSAGLIGMAASAGIDVNVLIRPRPGDFLYTDADCEIMFRDIAEAARCGARGVVIGALTADGDVDKEICRKLVEEAKSRGMSVTFHRAFDVCRNPEAALEVIVDLGCDRILTSGQASTAEKGIGLLRDLQEQADGRIIIMAGCGVNPSNAKRIVDETGVEELHASARGVVKSGMLFRNPAVSMGTPGEDEYSRLSTSEDIVKQLSELLKNY